MAMICKKCGGIIPDIVVGVGDRNDCRCHKRKELNINPLKVRS